MENRGDVFSEYMANQTGEIFLEIAETGEGIDKRKELDIVPIEDALLVSDHSSRRKIMIDVLKLDTLQNMEVIKTAVLNEDAETSHYAVTAVMEVKRKLSIAMQELSVRYDQDKEDPSVVSVYAQVLKEYLKSGFLDEHTIRKYKYTYIQVLQQLILLQEENKETFEEKFKTELELKEYLQAENTCMDYFRRFPHAEEPYLSLMKLYFTTKSPIQMQSVLDKLIKSPIKLSNRGLVIVRYLSGGKKHESIQQLL